MFKNLLVGEVHRDGQIFKNFRNRKIQNNERFEDKYVALSFDWFNNNHANWDIINLVYIQLLSATSC